MSLDATVSSSINHRGPHLGLLALGHTILFLSGLFFVVTFSGGPHFPGPWEPSPCLLVCSWPA
jgi:hypothetical protein